MNTSSSEHPIDRRALDEMVTKINSVLERYSDKDWNFSRISLEIKDLQNSDSPYLLWPERIDLANKTGRNELKNLRDELKWGERHSSELGVLELVSLRVNKALLESSNDEFWKNKRPVVRLIKIQVLAEQGVESALWYRIREVQGEYFDNR